MAKATQPAATPHTVIIGGTWGTGLAVARYFRRRGHSISIVGRRAKPRDLACAFFRADLSETASLSVLLPRIVRRTGPWDNLVFVQRYRGTGDTWQGEWTVGVEATRLLVEAAVALPAPREKTEARSIVLFNSIASHLIAAGQPEGYHAAKGALLQLARYYAATLGPRNIRVNSLSPATILKAPPSDPEHQARIARLEAHIPLRRMGRPEEMASAAYLLCDPAAAYITGHDLIVDGGISLLAQEGLVYSLLASTNLPLPS